MLAIFCLFEPSLPLPVWWTEILILILSPNTEYKFKHLLHFLPYFTIFIQVCEEVDFYDTITTQFSPPPQQNVVNIVTYNASATLSLHR